MQEDEGLVTQCRSQNQKLIEFMTRKENLVQLIKYATQLPENPDNHTEAHKYPFMAIDILTSSIRMAKAIAEGGYTVEPEQPESDNIQKQATEENQFSEQSETNMV